MKSASVWMGRLWLATQIQTIAAPFPRKRASAIVAPARERRLGAASAGAASPEPKAMLSAIRPYRGAQLGARMTVRELRGPLPAPRGSAGWSAIPARERGGDRDFRRARAEDGVEVGRLS